MSFFEEHHLTEDERTALLEFSRLPWRSQFHKTIDNPSAPGGKVDMYLMLDEESGEGGVSIAVPHGAGQIANWIAACCARPWFVDPQLHNEKTVTEIAVAFNRALAPFRNENGQYDGRDIVLGAITIIGAYMRGMPKHARQELANRLLVNINALIGE